MLPLKDLNPSRRKPYITYLIVLINVLVFLYELTLGRETAVFFRTFGFVPLYFTYYIKGGTNSPYIVPIFTSMFIHGGWAHIIGNMWYLLIFGDNVEDRLGRILYLLLYFSSGLVAALTQYLISPLSKIPMIGASGAISGVLGAYLVLFPGAKIISLVPDPFSFGLFYRIVPLSAFLYLFFWFVIQLFQGLATLPFAGQIGGTAFWAHIGGFVMGVIFALAYTAYSRLTGIKRYRRS